MTDDASSLSLDEHLAETLRKAVDGTLRDAFQINTRPETWSVGRRVPMVLDALEVCWIDMKQEDVLCGAFITAFSRDIILKVLSQYGPGTVSDQKMIDDAAGEMANMIYGMFKTMMNKSGYHLVMDIPSTLNEKKCFIDKYEQSEKMILPFLADGHQCQIIVAQKA